MSKKVYDNVNESELPKTGTFYGNSIMHFMSNYIFDSVIDLVVVSYTATFKSGFYDLQKDHDVSSQIKYGGIYLVTSNILYETTEFVVKDLIAPPTSFMFSVFYCMGDSEGGTKCMKKVEQGRGYELPDYTDVFVGNTLYLAGLGIKTASIFSIGAFHHSIRENVIGGAVGLDFGKAFDIINVIAGTFNAVVAYDNVEYYYNKIHNEVVYYAGEIFNHTNEIA